MRIGVMGTGMVGKAIATRLVELGHDVRMGSRSASNEAAEAWAAEHGERATNGDFADTAAFGELVFNCTSGQGTLAALEQAGADNLAGKVLVDVANPLDWSTGELRLTVCNTDSLGEQVQRALPRTRVVKALNTMNCSVMVEPGLVAGDDHLVLMCGDDATAKADVAALLGEFGWTTDRIVDLGGITAARGQEMFLPLWVELMRARGSATFNLAIRGAGPA
ncbi:MAG: NAD(P)-binding domain-containing protein [Thermoleophilia bacterium]|nr:NAD(P)-binding domain-containing protein [Thermoleophilia bacterium]